MMFLACRLMSADVNNITMHVVCACSITLISDACFSPSPCTAGDVMPTWLERRRGPGVAALQHCAASRRPHRLASTRHCRLRAPAARHSTRNAGAAQHPEPWCGKAWHLAPCTHPVTAPVHTKLLKRAYLGTGQHLRRHASELRHITPRSAPCRRAVGVSDSPRYRFWQPMTTGRRCRPPEPALMNLSTFLRHHTNICQVVLLAAAMLL